MLYVRVVGGHKVPHLDTKEASVLSRLLLAMACCLVQEIKLNLSFDSSPGFLNWDFAIQSSPCKPLGHSASKISLCTSQIEASTSPPPGQPPGCLNFWKIFGQIPPSLGRKAVQMPHHRSIPGDQMPPPLGNFSVAFNMLQKLCM